VTGVPDVRLEIDRTVDPGEYEAVQFGDWRRWHAVAPGADRTMCGLDHVNQRAQRMFHRWMLESDRCRKCKAHIQRCRYSPADA